MSNTFTYTNQYGEKLTVRKDGNRIVITHTDIPDVEMIWEDNLSSYLLRQITGNERSAVVRGDDGEHYTLSDDEAAFVEKVIAEQGW